MKFKNPVSVVPPVDGEHATNKDYVDDKMVTKTWAEYQALSEEEKNNGTLYDIPDMPVGIGGGGFAVNGNLYPTNAIDDNAVSPNTGWSSKKVMDKLASVKSIIRVDAKPTYADGTITYVKDGTSYTTTDHETWFYYVVNDELYKTIFIDGVEYTKADSSVSFDDFIKKTDIVTVLDATATNKQVVGAKAVWDCIENLNVIKTYTHVSQLGLTNGCSVGDVFNAMPDDSLAELPCQMQDYADDTTVSYITDLPSSHVLLIIRKHIASTTIRFEIAAKQSAKDSVTDNFMWIGQLKGLDGSGISWKRVCTTSVPDVAKTDISSKVINASISPGGAYYSVKNGICYVQIAALNVSTSTDGVAIFHNGTFPKIDIDNSNGHYPVTSPHAVCGLLAFDGNGAVRYYGGSTTIYATISYPVAEDWRP